MTSNPNKDHEDLREPEQLPPKDRKAPRPDEREDLRDTDAKSDNPLSRLHFGSAGSGGAELEPPSKPQRP